MRNTVIGFFRNSLDAYSAADELKNRGFENSRIDVSTEHGKSEHSEDEREKTGKVGSFFKSLFSGDDDNADKYSHAARNYSLVTVHASDEQEAERAADILDDCGAVDIDEREPAGSAVGSTDDMTVNSMDSDDVFSQRDSDIDFHESDESSISSDRNFENRRLSTERDNSRLRPDRDFDNTNEASIPIIEEEVNVGKREVRSGGVRVRSRIIERPVEETLRLREEHVNVERNPVDRDASDAELDNFHEETIEIDEMREEPLISKRARVVEEVKVTRDVRERKETVRETQRRTQVDVEDLEDTDDVIDSDVSPDTE